MRYGIKILAHGATGPELEPAEWVVYSDPDGGDPEIDYPTGAIVSSDDPERAMAFASFDEAVLYWQRQSERTPLRPDGRPNRPLTAFTVEIEPLP